MTIRLLRFSRFAALVFLAGATTTMYSQEWAKTRLDASPRHHEYVALKHDGRTVQALVVYPEAKGKTPVVVMIHEIFGLTDWAKEMADEVAAQGYIVVEPDLLSSVGRLDCHCSGVWVLCRQRCSCRRYGSRDHGGDEERR
jgi:carboxymethylenebutenolidase